MNGQEIENIIRTKASANPENDEPFYIMEANLILDQYLAWKRVFPKIRPFYAIKCNTDPVILRMMRAFGCRFDCASSEEISTVLALGADPIADVIFANPCKFPSHIRAAKAAGVRRMTFDNEDELVKVAQLYPDAEMVLRIATDDSHSMCAFSSKFGARMPNVPSILKRAAELKVAIVGVSYHVGSGCADFSSYEKASNDALKIFEMGREYGFEMHVLDVGGGFLATETPEATLAEVGKFLNPVLEKFPANTEFIAEPGRYFASRPFTVAIKIHSRRVIKDEAGNISQVLYYATEGVYHSFNCIFFDHQHPCPIVVPREGRDDTKMYSSTVFGPTCDSIDCICKDHDMPLLEIGDWLYFKDMGAYTIAAVTKFNGFKGAATIDYYWDKVLLKDIEGDLTSKVTEALKKC